MRWVSFAAVLVAATALGGCSDGPSKEGPAAADDFGVAPTATTGVVLGIVVDDVVQPVAAATVTLRGPGTERTASTDAEGRFAFADVAPGSYFVTASHPVMAGAQSPVDVAAGDPDPDLVRLQLSRLFSQEPYTEAIKFAGFIQCGYVAVLVSSLCLNDYSTLVVNGGCCPELREVLDNRGYVSAVGAGWQAMVFELLWEPSAEGTSPEMFVLVSHTNRTASDWFGEVGGPSPVLLRFNVSEPHPTGEGEPPMVPPEGMPNLYTFAGIDGGVETPAGEVGLAAGFSQEFEIFQHNFYYGVPPPDWSFVRGDPPPF